MRLLRLTFTMIFLIGTVIVASRLIGSTYPRPVIATIFTNPDGLPCEMPCMFGIEPQNTGLADMLKITGSHPYFLSLKRTVETSSSGKLYKFADKNHLITIQLNANDVVQSITWGSNSCNPSWLPTVADIISVLGNPSLVSVQPFRFSATTYIYTAFHIEIASNRERLEDDCKYVLGNARLNPQDIVIAVFIESPTYTENAKKGIPWQGFQQAQVYFTQ